MPKSSLIGRIRLACIKYLFNKSDGRSTISSNDKDAVNTYWIYLLEVLPKEKQRERENVKELGELVWPDEERKYIVDSVSTASISIRQLKETDEDPDHKPFELVPNDLAKYQFEIRFFLRETETKYKSPVLAAFHRLTKWAYVKLFSHRYQRWSADRTIKLLQERISVLETITELEDMHGTYGAGAQKLTEELYGPNYVRSSGAQKVRVYRRIKRILNSLVSTGELEEINHGYRTTGKATATLFEYKESVKRHEDLNRIQVVMVVATVVIAASALIELSQAVDLLQLGRQIGEYTAYVVKSVVISFGGD